VTQLEDGRRYWMLEELTNFCTLGLRFWDAVTDAQIRGGLRVRLWPEAALYPVVEAGRTYSDIYAFHRVPGLGAVERPVDSRDGLAGSPASVPFVLEVTDLERRFVPNAIGLSLPLPHRGLFLTQLPGSPVPATPGFYLFSAPTRNRAANIAVVRGELVDTDVRQGAAHALVMAELPGEDPVYGVADADGAFALHFPYPTLPGGLRPLDASPPGPLGPPMAERSWQLRVSVFYQPELLVSLPGTELPDVRNIFRQARAGLLLESNSPSIAADQWSGTLDFGGEVVVRTEAMSALEVVPAT
jgi:hypothetical protein